MAVRLALAMCLLASPVLAQTDACKNLCRNLAEQGAAKDIEQMGATAGSDRIEVVNIFKRLYTEECVTKCSMTPDSFSLGYGDSLDWPCTTREPCSLD